ncbi:SLOG family protein [Streptomyces griseorubiginosus]|uniref:SLOG family protein n=1 Tax=Streptomyces griseorubiginosus TaxID=67304 RepID=UPI0036EC72D0
MTTYRILITGSRNWTDRRTIEDTLTAAGALAIASGQRLTVVHGACPTGADAIAQEWADWHREHGQPIDIERHPAQNHPTEDFGPWPAAGPKRNAHMVNLGADACFAFIGPCTSRRCQRPSPHPSHGASGCAGLAEAAGIPVRRTTA